jgi:hypothetical protein
MSSQNSLLSFLLYSIPEGASPYPNPNQYLLIEFYQSCNKQTIVGAALISFTEDYPSDQLIKNVKKSTIITVVQPCPVGGAISVTQDLNVNWDGTDNYRYAITATSDLGSVNFITGETFTQNCNQNGFITVPMSVCRKLNTGYLDENSDNDTDKKKNYFLIVLLIILLIAFLFFFASNRNLFSR